MGENERDFVLRELHKNSQVFLTFCNKIYTCASISYPVNELAITIISRNWEVNS